MTEKWEKSVTYMLRKKVLVKIYTGIYHTCKHLLFKKWVHGLILLAKEI